MKTENISDPPVGQAQSSSVAVALGAPICAALASIVLTAMAYRVLPTDAAKDLMAQINPMLLVAGGGSSIVGAVGIVQRGITITKAKLAHQLKGQG